MFLQLVQKPIMILGDFSIFVGEIWRNLPRFWMRRDAFIKQCEIIGVGSAGIIFFAAVFFGAVLGYQMYVSLHWLGAEALLGGTVGVGLFREMAPVLTGIMVTGRAGAAMTAEIASMKLTEQVDALEVMAVDPIEYLVVPRVVAGVVMTPILAVFFSGVASLAAAGIGCGVMGLDSTIYWAQYAKYTDRIDIVHCVVKATAFGLLIAWISCFSGFKARGATRAVGFATRTTMVATCLAILLWDYMITALLPFGLSTLIVE